MTVERREGGWREDPSVRFVDLPGVYSLSPDTPEEVVLSLIHISFQGMTNYLGWERVGVISALSCGDLAAMERTDYPQQAYELGKNLR